MPFGGTIHFFPSLDSTNTKARELSDGGAPEGTVVVSGAQTAGRGRQGRPWISEPGKNLLLSVILRPRIDPDLLGTISLYASVSVAACVGAACGAPAGCKWPNDVVVSGKKICGILSESVVTARGVDAVILGIGLNVNQETFPAAPGVPPGNGGPGGPGLPGTRSGPLHLNATSMRIETGRTHDLAEVLCALLAELETRYPSVRAGRTETILEEWTRRSVILGSRVNVERGGSSFSGIAAGLAPTGALRVDTPGGTVEVTAGEVHLL
jgi:BirA family biotin operon repressor/biotin-[acetyl-CoA-carboxylase] ligase